MAPNEAHKAPMDFLMVAGDGREDEVIFRWANDLGKSDYVEFVTTVSLGSRNTEAMYTLTQGVTGQFFLSFCLEEVVTNGLQVCLRYSRNLLLFPHADG
jgi:trehalose-6-phosphatase